MRYRIVIELDTDAKRVAVNNLACDMQDLCVTTWCNPVYVATEIVQNEQRAILYEKDE